MRSALGFILKPPHHFSLSDCEKEQSRVEVDFVFLISKAIRSQECLQSVESLEHVFRWKTEVLINCGRIIIRRRREGLRNEKTRTLFHD